MTPIDAGSPPPFQGALLGHLHGAVFGWACAADGSEVVVEILGDDEPLALVRSGIRVPEQTLALVRPGMGLPESFAFPPDRSQNGFVAMIGATRFATLGRITARIANTAAMLPGVIFPSDEFRGPVPSAAGVLNRDGLRLHGWLIPDPVTGAPSKVLALSDGEWIAEGIADRHDPHLGVQGAPEGACAFDINLPLSLADGESHRVTVCSDDGTELPGSPLTVRVTPEGDRRWIQRLGLPAADRDILLALAERWRRDQPQSLGWSAYPEWKRRFGSAARSESDVRVLVVIGPHRAGEGALRTTLESVTGQTHRRWQVLAWTDATAEVPAGTAAADEPRVVRVPAHQWAQTLTSAMATAAFAGFIPAGDTWHPDLLAHALHALGAGADIACCDADDLSGGPPWFKPDWCVDTFLALPLLDHGFICRAGLLRTPSPDPQDWPWQAVATAGGVDARVAHVRHALHTRGDGRPASASRIGPAQEGRPDIAPLVHAHFGVSTWNPAPEDGTPVPHRVAWPDPPAWPTVCLIVPTRDRHDLLRACIDSLRATDYPGLSLCVIDNQSVCPATLAYLDALTQQGVRVLRWPHPFNYAAMHDFAVAQLDADVIGLVNNDVRALDAHWLRAMVRHLVRPGVGATGAKLLWPNGMVQHGGVVLGLHGAAGHTGNQWLADDAGYHHCNRIARSVSAVTAACLLLRRADYLAAGGMDPRAFPVAFNDVDLCLKLRARGQRIVWVADAVLEHAESVSRGADDSPARRGRLARECAALASRWGDLLTADPFYNPNLNLDRYSHDGLAVPPRHLG